MIIFYYKEGAATRGKNHFLPLLKQLTKYPFPKPSRCSCLIDAASDWVRMKITSFTSVKLLKYLETRVDSPRHHTISVDGGSEAHLQLNISYASAASTLGLMNPEVFVNNSELKALFKALISCNSLCDEAICGPVLSDIWNKHFLSATNHNKPMLTWLQYFGKAALEKRGGETAFQSNPYVQIQRIQDGLLVQVGDDPSIFDTLEGEELLVNAINALPLIKH